MKKISILGCGWLGKALAFHLAEKGYAVQGSTRSENDRQDFENKGVRHHVVDVSSTMSSYHDFLETDILIVCIPLKKIAPFEWLINKIKLSPIKKVIYTSSISVYDNCNDIVTEDSPTNSSPLVEVENMFKNMPCDSVILRLGGLFGYDRNPVNFISKHKKMKNPNGYINFIHRDDCVSVIEEIIEQDVRNEVFNVCSPHHSVRQDYYTALAKKHGRPLPVFEPNEVNYYKIISSEKLIYQLNYSFKQHLLQEN